jgi:hypothetical protein
MSRAPRRHDVTDRLARRRHLKVKSLLDADKTD